MTSSSILTISKSTRNTSVALTPWETRSLCQSEQMRMALRFHWVPWIYPDEPQFDNGQWKSQNYPGVTGTTEDQRHSIFLGFNNFYRWFIHNYLEITVPLTQLTWKGTTWNFTLECRSTFELLKKAFTPAPILTHWIPDQPLVVEIDTSDYTLTATLSMYTPDRELHPITFHSRTFSSAELNYEVHDKELLAIYKAFRRWWHYLEGSMSPVDVVTNHKVWSTSLWQSFSCDDKHDGPNTSPSLVW